MLLCSHKEIREVFDFPQKQGWDQAACSGSVRRGLKTVKAEAGGAFLKVTCSVPGRRGRSTKRANGWMGDGDERGRSLDHVAVETESSVGRCEVRGVILGGDCTSMQGVL